MEIPKSVQGYIRDAIWFAIGAGVGVGVTKLIVEKKMQTYADEQIEDVKRRYSRREEYRIRQAEQDAQEQVDEVMEVVSDMQGNNEVIINPDKKPDLATYVNQTLIEKHNYSNPQVEVDREELDRKLDEVRANAKPYLISYDQFTDECEFYDKISMTFYALDETFVDEYEDPVADPFSLIPDNILENWGFGSDDPDMAYVRNDAIAADYEVTRLHKRSGL